MNPLRYLSGWLDLREQAATEAALSAHLQELLKQARRQRDDSRREATRLALKVESLEHDLRAVELDRDNASVQSIDWHHRWEVMCRLQDESQHEADVFAAALRKTGRPDLDPVAVLEAAQEDDSGVWRKRIDPTWRPPAEEAM